MALGDYERWRQETGALYDQVIANFYRALDERDKVFLQSCNIDIYGDNRLPYRKDL